MSIYHLNIYALSYYHVFRVFSFHATFKNRFGIILDDMVVSSRVDEEKVCIPKCIMVNVTSVS